MENGRVCDGQCEKCNLIQQTYCSAVRTHAMMENERVFSTRLEHIEEVLSELAKRLGSENIIIAQGGSGAEKATKKQLTIKD